MSKKFRNPRTGEVLVLEEGDEESIEIPVKPEAKREVPNAKETKTAESSEPETEEDVGDAPTKETSHRFCSPFDFLDEINGKDVEKIVLGAALGIGGVLAVKGMRSFFNYD